MPSSLLFQPAIRRAGRALLFCAALLFNLIAPLPLSAQSGLHYTPEELTVWRQRAGSTATSNTTNYRVAGDVQLNSPGDWTRIISRANEFKANPSTSIWQGTATPGQSQPFIEGITLEAAAFAYLIYKNSNPTLANEYATAVKNALLTQIGIANANIGNWDYSTIPDKELGFFESRWLTRLLFAYDYIKETITDQTQRNNLNTWFRNAAVVMMGNVNVVLNQNFPDRLDGVTATSCAEGSYTQMGRNALPSPGYTVYANSGPYVVSGYPNGTEYTHVNANGSLGNHIPVLAMHYNNRRAAKVTLAGLVGIFLNDISLQCQSKIYVKEWLKYSVFPDGTQGEYERNGDYGNPQQGIYYGSMNIQMAIMLADAFARRGDNELYNYTTSDGLHGTQGGAKSIRLTIDRYIGHMTNNPAMYHLSASSVDNRIDHISPGDKEAVWDILFAIANKFYKADALRNTYTRNKTYYPNINDFTTNLHTAGPSGVPWGGNGVEFPGILFMFGQMENYGLNKAPTVSITAPSNNQSFTAGASISITANAADTDGTVSKVEFFQGGTKLGEDLTSPYGYTWTTAGTGTYSLTARATDNNGATTTSSAVTITVTSGLTPSLLEAETYYTELADVGTNGTVGANSCSSLSNGQFVRMYDKGDKISINFEVPQSGTYQVRARIRSGDANGSTTFWNGVSYLYTVDGTAQTLTGDVSTVSGAISCVGTSYWGTMKSGNIALSQGQHYVTVEANGYWCAIDYVEIVRINTLFEAENNYTVLTDVGTNATVKDAGCASLSNGRFVQLYDNGDKVRINFEVPQSGTYQVHARIRSGDANGSTTYWNRANYLFAVNGTAQTFTGDPATVSGAISCIGTSYWGTMKSGNLTLSQGQNYLTLEVDGDWAAIDYIELVQVASGSRLAVAGMEPELPPVRVRPNPFSDRITVTLDGSQAGAVVVSLTDILGKVYWSRELAAVPAGREVDLNLTGKRLEPGIYFLKVSGQGTPVAVVKMLKQ